MHNFLRKNKKEYVTEIQKTLTRCIEKNLYFCCNRKNLDYITIKSYRISYRQYKEFVFINKIGWNVKARLNKYINHMLNQYKPEGNKRKITSIKALLDSFNSSIIKSLRYLHSISKLVNNKLISNTLFHKNLLNCNRIYCC